MIFCAVLFFQIACDCSSWKREFDTQVVLTAVNVSWNIVDVHNQDATTLVFYVFRAHRASRKATSLFLVKLLDYFLWQEDPINELLLLIIIGKLVVKNTLSSPNSRLDNQLGQIIRI